MAALVTQGLEVTHGAVELRGVREPARRLRAHRDGAHGDDVAGPGVSPLVTVCSDFSKELVERVLRGGVRHGILVFFPFDAACLDVLSFG